MMVGGSAAAACHLTYCSNIHPGETWDAVRHNLAEHLPAIKARLSPDRPFGVGLRLSAQAASALARPEAMREFKDFLARERLYVFTLNGFPYGTFHGTRVKEEVYLPDWRDERRLNYTDLLADVMAELMPDQNGAVGSVSTVPGAFKANARTPEAVEAIAGMIVRHCAHLVRLRARTGKHVTLALEPEPCCFLETVEESVAFFRDYLFADAAAGQLSALTGVSRGSAQQALRDHLGLCLDLCHAAVEFEDGPGCLAQLQQAGVAVYKLQISAGLRLPGLTQASLAGVREFDDPVYLHQVVESGPNGVTRYVDLPDALRSVGTRPLEGVEWRVHCHVPIFLDDLGAFSSTQSFVREMLQAHRRSPISKHLEVETYTWSVLPPHLRTDDLDHAIVRELSWVREELEGMRPCS